MRIWSYVIHDDRCRRCARCADVCPTGAACVPRGHAVTTSYGEVFIDQAKCDGCGKCMEACRLRAISKVLRLHF